jgi:hypothetical protein
MKSVTITLEHISTEALRSLVPVLLDEGNLQTPMMLQVRKSQAGDVVREVEKRTGWAETRLRHKYQISV